MKRSCSASFLRRDGTVWTTDKDGPILDLLAAEILARTGKDPGEHYHELTEQFGTPYYTRIDAPASPEEKARLQRLDPSNVKASLMAGEPITAKLTQLREMMHASAASRSSATAAGLPPAHPAPKISTRSMPRAFCDQSHLDAIVAEAQQIVADALT